MFGGIGPWELILVFVVVLLLFGAKRLPEIGASLGKGIREFKGSFREIENELKMPEDEPRRSVSPPRPEPRVEPQSEPRPESRAEPRPEPRAEPRPESRTEPGGEAEASGNGEARKLHSQ